MINAAVPLSPFATFWLVRPRDCLLSQQYENVTLEQSKNVPLTGSGWTGAGRTAIDEPSREGPVGDIAQGEEASHYASGSSGRVGRERTACEAAVESAEKTW